MHAAALLTEIAARWNDAGVRYAVSHGLEGYPDDLGRDVDVLVVANQVAAAAEAATDVLTSHGLTVVHPNPMWGRRVVAVDPESNAMLEVHLSTEVTWRGAVLVSRPNPTESVGVLAVDPWAAFAKRIVAPLLAGNAVKFERKPDEFVFRTGESEAAAAFLDDIMDARVAQRLHSAVAEGDLSAARSLAPELRRSVLLRSATRRPVSFIGHVTHGLVRKLMLPFSPCAPTVAFVGPDGAGKTTVINALANGDAGIFTAVVVRHWRPFLLPRLGAMAGRPPPTAASDGLLQPRRHAGRLGPVRLAYYYLDYFAGGFLKDRVANSRQQLVLYDRCDLDMQIDPLRYGLRSGTIPPLLRHLLPGPHLVVLLTCDAERIHARKPELPVSEIQRLLDAWQRLVDRGDVHHVLHTGDAPGEVVQQAQALITQAFVAVNQRQ